MQPQSHPFAIPGGTPATDEPFAGSEVARFRQQVELETRAAQAALTGPRIAGSHTIIQHYTDAIRTAVDLVTPTIGRKQAWQIAGEAYCTVMEALTQAEGAHAPTEDQSPSGNQPSQDRRNHPEKRARG